jgi:exonuclease III
MRVLCWNCHGIGNSATVRELHDLAKEYAPSVVFILETQIAKSQVENLRYFLGYDNSFAVNSNGRSGGLGIFWNNEVLLKITQYSQYHIDMEICDNSKGPWRLTFIYGEVNRAEREKTWNLLKFIKSHSYLPWIYMGDFNEILQLEEQFGPNPRENMEFAKIYKKP